MSDGFEVDSASVRGVADGMAASADAVGTASAAVYEAAFGVSGAGRNYGDLGAAYTQAHLGLGRTVGAWRSAVVDIAAALTTAMDEYGRQDDTNSSAFEQPR